jgi:hypothetical protein
MDHVEERPAGNGGVNDVQVGRELLAEAVANLGASDVSSSTTTSISLVMRGRP